MEEYALPGCVYTKLPQLSRSVIQYPSKSYIACFRKGGQHYERYIYFVDVAKDLQMVIYTLTHEDFNGVFALHEERKSIMCTVTGRKRYPADITF